MHNLISYDIPRNILNMIICMYIYIHYKYVYVYIYIHYKYVYVYIYTALYIDILLASHDLPLKKSVCNIHIPWNVPQRFVFGQHLALCWKVRPLASYGDDSPIHSPSFQWHHVMRSRANPSRYITIPLIIPWYNEN